MNFSRPLILASKSPRRQQLLREAGFDFEILTKETDESFPDDLPAQDVAAYISRKKADAFNIDLEDKILITSDTVVKVDKLVLGKPESNSEAISMLELLSGRMHEVITAVTLKDNQAIRTFSSITQVHFKVLEPAEITYYVSKYKPFDKAGAYGIQEWIGMIGIEKIEGSYFNVVGLPIDRLYVELRKFENSTSNFQ